MNTKKLRTIIPLVVLAIAGIGYVLHTGFGDLSALGWSSISVLCPLGALGTMLASKTVVPRALISLGIALVAIFILGRAFCGWICPVPVWQKLRTAFTPKKNEEIQQEAALKSASAELTEQEKKMLHTACGKHVCSPENRPSNSRTIVLGGALLSAAIFGFPVFCLICPIGLSFALVFVLIQLFGAGDLTWSVILIPVLLILEVTVFRKWCSHICPLSALMSLVGRFSPTLRPSIDDSKCIESSKNGSCGRCAQVCPSGIDPRHPEKGANWEECIKCRECVENCPGEAISIPLLPKKGGNTPVATDTAEVAAK